MLQNRHELGLGARVVACLLLVAPGPVFAAGQQAAYAPVLAPDQFVGEAAMGYSAAKAAPEICAKLFCYCGCDSTENHTRLLDCFTSTHGVDCHICQEEALMALRMEREGKEIKEIKKTVDGTYARMYPFKNPTQALKDYQSHRLYTGEPERVQATHSLEIQQQPCCSGVSDR